MSRHVLLLRGDTAIGFELPGQALRVCRTLQCTWVQSVRAWLAAARVPGGPENARHGSSAGSSVHGDFPQRVFTDTLTVGEGGTAPEPRNATRFCGQLVTLLIDSPEEEIVLARRDELGSSDTHRANLARAGGSFHPAHNAQAGWLPEPRPCISGATEHWVNRLLDQGMRVQRVYLLSGLAAALVPDRAAWLVVLGGGAEVRHVLVKRRQVLFVRHVQCRDNAARVQSLHETLVHLDKGPLMQPAWSLLCVGLDETVLDQLIEFDGISRLHSLAVGDTSELPVDAASWHLLKRAVRGHRRGHWHASPWQGAVRQSQWLRRLKQATAVLSAAAIASVGLAAAQAIARSEHAKVTASAMQRSTELLHNAQQDALALHAEPQALYRVMAEAAQSRERARRRSTQVTPGTLWVLQEHPDVRVQSLSWRLDRNDVDAVAALTSAMTPPVLRGWQQESATLPSRVSVELAGLVTGGTSLRDKQQRFEDFLGTLAGRWPRAQWHTEQAPVDATRSQFLGAIEQPAVRDVDEAAEDTSAVPFVVRGQLGQLDDLDV